MKKVKSGKKLWGGRFTEATRNSVDQFTASIGFDRRLALFDIIGSLAHCKTLYRGKLLTKSEMDQIIGGLNAIRDEIESGQFDFREEAEDIHMNIEKRLIEIIGSTGGKLHTGRSRNDQVILDLRLYLRHEIGEILSRAGRLQETLIVLARKHLGAIVPGYTHLQRAQPVLLSHHWLAYFEMLERDRERGADLSRRVNVMPLGSGALAGSGFPLDRKYTASLLNFPEVSQNSLDAVSDRDFVIEFHAFASICMMHLSRLCEELILWSTTEFAFVEIPDGFCTGSSMMPQKKNPDVPELIRGKTGHFFGHLVASLTLMKGLPLSYNRDLQEDKEPLFRSVDILKSVLSLLCELLSEIKINREKMERESREGFLLATDVADYLVARGVPFRESHETAGKIVRYCLESGKALDELTLSDYHRFSGHFGRDILDLSPSVSINRRDVIGGTAFRQVSRRVSQLEKRRIRK